MIIFRADGGSFMGLGHVMRLLTIADEVKKQNREVLFVLADENVSSLVRERGFAYVVLNTRYDTLEEELPMLLSLIKEKNAKAIVVDSYFVTPPYLHTLREAVKTVYIDDLAAFPYDVDVLINYNIYAGDLDYESQRRDGRKLCLGCDFVPLRAEFLKEKKEALPFHEQVEEVLLSTGGSDHYGLAKKIMERLAVTDDFSKRSFHIVSGMANPFLKDLQELSNRYANIKLHVNEKNMAGLMKGMDLAISAGGSTLYELAAMGVPTICFWFAENQKRLVESFVKNKMTLGGYDFLSSERNMLAGIEKDFHLLCEDTHLREKLRQRAKQLVDGEGAKRIANLL